MRKVKYILEDIYIYPDLTINKIYDVIAYHKSPTKKENDWITILNDDNIQDEYMLYTYYEGALGKTPIFIDATEEYRNEIIDDILS